MKIKPLKGKKIVNSTDVNFTIYSFYIFYVKFALNEKQLNSIKLYTIFSFIPQFYCVEIDNIPILWSILIIIC